jgi:hypothetical protein
VIDSMREPAAGAIGPLDKICRGPLVHAVAGPAPAPSPGRACNFRHYRHAPSATDGSFVCETNYPSLTRLGHR